MEDRHVFGKRKRKKEKIENLYKILGTRSNISQERIKEKYIEKLKEFPPETYPEEFQEIRRAYEVLKNPQKRKQYDMMRKYGDKIEKTMEDAIFSMSIGNYDDANRLLEYINEIDPGNIVVKLTQAEISVELEDFERFESLMDEVLKNSTIEDKEYIIFIKFSILNNRGYQDRALEALEKGKEYIINVEHYHWLRAMSLLESDNYDKAWGEFKDALPPIVNIDIEQMDILIAWLNTAIELDKWGEISKIQNYFKQVFKKIEDEEELYMVEDQLLEEAEDYIYAARFRAADIFMQLLTQLNPKDVEARERRREIQAMVKLDMEISRLIKDQETFPFVMLKVLDLYLAKYSDEEVYEEFMDDFPHNMMMEMEWEKEEIAYGILRMKKRYPSLYREFNKELMDLFNQSTEGLNREQRRRLR